MELDLSDDEIEIVEIVGLDEDSPAARPIRDRPVSTAPVEDEENSAEIVLDLDDGSDDSQDFVPGIVAPTVVSEREQLLRLSADFENSRSPPRLINLSILSSSKASTATSISSMTFRSNAVASSAPSRCSRRVSPSVFASNIASPSESLVLPIGRALME